VLFLSFVLQIAHKCYSYISLQLLSLPKRSRVQGTRFKVCSSEFWDKPCFRFRSPFRNTNVLSLVPYTLYLIPIFIFCLIPATLPAANAAQVTLAWDKSPESNIDGYRVHYGTSSGYYEQNVDVGNHTSCTISGLEEGTSYYFAATAYNTNNVESSLSEELAHTIANQPPPPPIDTDGDGIPDNDEINIYGTDPNKIDTDGDGINDGAEITLWENDWDTDFDNDGLINLLDPDSDDDGNLDDGPPAALAPTPISPLPDLNLEIGEVQIDHNWQYVRFSKSFIDPIVVSRSLSLNGNDPEMMK